MTPKAAAVPEKTGTSVIRQSVKSWARTVAGFVILARDTGISKEQLDDFMNDRRSLPASSLSALARVMFDGATFDADRNLLVAKPGPEPTSIGVMPKRLVAGVDFIPATVVHDYTKAAPRPMKPEPPGPMKLVPPPGWAE